MGLAAVAGTVDAVKHRNTWFGALALAAAALVLGAAPVAMAQQRVACSTLLREFNRVSSRRGTVSADPVRLARKLGTTPAWVERCADLYGRRLREKVSGSAKLSRQVEIWEAEELAEVGREEVEAQGDVYLTEIEENDKAKARALRRREGTWVPYTLSDWEPDTGRAWAPYEFDNLRMPKQDVPGLITK